MAYNSLSPHIRLPHRIVRGSVRLRKEHSLNYVDRLYKDLYPKFMHGEVSVDEVQKSVDKVIGLKGKVHVIKNSASDYFGGQDILMSDYTGKISALSIELDTDSKGLKIPDLVTIVHEFQHVADIFFHPKYAARYQNMVYNELYTPQYDKIYGDLFYKQHTYTSRKEKNKILKKIENKFRNFLKKVPLSDRINYIQDTRYYLISEQDAYKTQLKYARMLKRKKHEVLKEDLTDVSKSFMFREKIKMLNNLGAEVIQKERLKLAKAQKKQAKKGLRSA